MKTWWEEGGVPSASLLRWTPVKELHDIACEPGMKHAMYAQHFRSPENCFPLMGKPESQSQPWGMDGSRLYYLSAPVANRPFVTVAAMVADFIGTEGIQNKRKRRVEKAEKQRILPTIKWQKGGPLRCL